MPASLICALVQVKRAAATVNATLGLLSPGKAQAIVAAADEVLQGQHHTEFPLLIWQSGYGTQTHMNVVEVLANRASELMGGERGMRRGVHPNDDVNLGQSSNDVFPTAMHVAVVTDVADQLLPSLNSLAGQLANLTGRSFVEAPNKFSAIASQEPLILLHGSLKALAVALNKIANDVRWMASGPRCGLGEINLRQNEPGSSIMPGKVNPTQCEALTMVRAQVFGNDVAIAFGAAGGNFELNAYKPLIAYNVLQSVRLLSDAMTSFEAHCVRGIEANTQRIASLMQQSLMLATALTPHTEVVKVDAAARE